MSLQWHILSESVRISLLRHTLTKSALSLYNGTHSQRACESLCLGTHSQRVRCLSTMEHILRERQISLHKYILTESALSIYNSAYSQSVRTSLCISTHLQRVRCLQWNIFSESVRISLHRHILTESVLSLWNGTYSQSACASLCISTHSQRVRCLSTMEHISESVRISLHRHTHTHTHTHTHKHTQTQSAPSLYIGTYSQSACASLCISTHSQRVRCLSTMEHILRERANLSA